MLISYVRTKKKVLGENGRIFVVVENLQEIPEFVFDFHQSVARLFLLVYYFLELNLVLRIRG